MNRIYFDNGATSFPKAPGVGEAVLDAINNVGGSVNRGISKESMKSEYVIYETREMLCELFNFQHPDHVVFTKNVTESINLILKSFLKSGDHVIISSIEHNAVMRPLHILENHGVEVTTIPVTIEGDLSLTTLEASIRENTKMIFMTHASNVTGTVIPIESVGDIAKKHEIRYVVDGAQTAGHRELDMEKISCDALCFTGHKGLLGPQGIGGFLIKKEFAKELTTYIEGGTGSKSNSLEQPTYMPDKFESGTPNVPGIYGLNAALHYIKKTTVEAIHSMEEALVDYFLEKLSEMELGKFIGASQAIHRSNVISIDFIGYDNAIVSSELIHKFGISNRCGMHCAPMAHKTFGTFPQGTVRFSVSQFNTRDEIDFVITAIEKVLEAY